KQGKNWDEWSTNGGIYVDDNNLVTAEHTEWNYYIIDADQSKLTGILEYEGFYLNLSQAAYPVNSGFQVGHVANNRNTEWGMYTRLYTNGFFDGEEVQGWGEIFLQGNQGPELFNECSYELTRIWTATDACGNSTSVQQVILVEDTIAPVFTVIPDDLVVQCDEEVGVSEVEAVDNCGQDVNLFYTDYIVDGECANQYTIERTWVAEDNCLNRTYYLQIIEVVDTSAPEFTDVPEDMTVECSDIPAPYNVSAEDNCSEIVSITMDEITEPGECTGEYTIIRTWTAIDECGNSASYTQVINVEDTTAPVFDNAPANITVDCANVPDPSEVTATDNCSEVTITFEETEFSGGCPGVLQRIWTATDACGNVAVHEQYINLIDTVAPVLANLPEDATYECDEEIPAPAEVSATDNCDDAVEVIF